MSLFLRKQTPHSRHGIFIKFIWYIYSNYHSFLNPSHTSIINVKVCEFVFFLSRNIECFYYSMLFNDNHVQTAEVKGSGLHLK